MMVLFFPFLLILSHLVCGCITTLAQPGALWGDFKDRMERKWIGGSLPKWVVYPLIVCETCISWTWGSVSYWIAGLWLLDIDAIMLLKWWPWMVAGCAYLNHRAWTRIYADKAICNANNSSAEELGPKSSTGSNTH